ncbi:MAG: hypothetical protein KC416_02845, partial [Myxococcales bacterium]|nr:hypothetical protein [Myxococcales bacterium]
MNDRSLRSFLFVLGSALVLATGAVFVESVWGDFAWDDHSLIVHNSRVRDPKFLPELLTSSFWKISSADAPGNPVYARLYRPVVSVAYLAQFQLFGDSPEGFHVVSVILHMICVCLVFAWLGLRIGEGRGEAAGRRGWIAAAFGAALFAFHPSRVESVAWVSGSTDLWMTLFVMLGLFAWRYRTRPIGLGLSAVAFTLAFFAKETAIVVPGLLVADGVLLHGLSLRNKGIRPYLGLFGILAVVLAFRLWVVPIFGGAPARQGTIGVAVARILSSLGHYVMHVLWPWIPSIHPTIRRTSPTTGEFLFDAHSLAIGAAVLVGLAVLILVARRWPRARPWLADSLWFVLPLLPVLNIADINTYSLTAYRFLYFPLIGVASMTTRCALAFIDRGP